MSHMQLVAVKSLKAKSDMWGNHLSLDCTLRNMRSGEHESGVVDWDIPKKDWDTMWDIFQRMVDESWTPELPEQVEMSDDV